MDSNHRRRKPADLQSAPFGHSGICPFKKLCFNNESGRRGSNPRPSAWKANALSTELLPHLYFCGQGWIRTTEGISQQIYSLPHLATLVLALSRNYVSIMRAEDGTQTRDPQLGRLMLYQLSYFRISIFVGKDGFEPPKA